MKKARSKILVVLVVFLLFMSYGYKRLIPIGKKISSNQNPTACASCHIDTESNSLSAMLKRIEEHPDVPAESVADCLNCHQEGDRSWSNGIHRGHYQGKSTFETKYNGSCVNCHKLTEKGDVVIPGIAPKATKYATVNVANIVVSPGGCAGCHKKKYAVMDFNLEKIVNKLPNHPKINFRDVNQCYDCHGQSAPNLAKLLHPRHLRNIVYQKVYANSCINCHKMEENGSVIVTGRKQ